MSKTFKVLMLTVTIFFTIGCGAITNLSANRSYTNDQFYGSGIFVLQPLGGTGNEFVGMKHGVLEGNPFIVAGCMLSLPLSLPVDILSLPYIAYRRW